jgi:hypothetical protein
MTGVFPPKVVAPGEGKTVMLFGVTIQDDRIEELERTYGVKL